MPPVYPNNLNLIPGYPQYNPSAAPPYMPPYNQSCAIDPNMLYPVNRYIPNQVAFTIIKSPSGEDIYATNSCDTLTFLNGPNISISGDKYSQSITIGTSDISANSFITFDCPNGTDPVATISSDTLTLLDGSGITITGDATNKTIRFDASGSSTNSFITFDCPNGTDPVATISSDTLTLLDSSSVKITGNATNKTIKFDISGITILDNGDVGIFTSDPSRCNINTPVVDISGDLKVSGTIDPTSLVLTGQTSAPYVVAADSSDCVIWFDKTNAELKATTKTGSTGLKGETGPPGADGANGDTFPVGMISPFAGYSAPTGWLLCDGSSYSSATYPDLNEVIGTTYGGGGGNFNVPDLRGRAIFGTSTSGTPGSGIFSSLTTGAIGTVVGNDYLTEAQMPSHEHNIDIEINHEHNISTEVIDGGDGMTTYDVASAPGSNQGAGMMTDIIELSAQGLTDIKGSDDPYLPPALLLNYIIKH